MRVSAIVGVSLALASTVAAVASGPNAAFVAKTEHYRVLGPGSDSCESWTAAHRAESARAQEQDAWMLGYITAVNRWGGGPEDHTKSSDTGAVVAWISSICARQQADSVAGAANLFIHYLGLPNRLPLRPGK